jgi:hypothetical protein
VQAVPKDLKLIVANSDCGPVWASISLTIILQVRGKLLEARDGLNSPWYGATIMLYARVWKSMRCSVYCTEYASSY